VERIDNSISRSCSWVNSFGTGSWIDGNCGGGIGEPIFFSGSSTTDVGFITVIVCIWQQ